MRSSPFLTAAALSAVALAGAIGVRAAQEPAPNQTFRSGVDVIQLDVSVLDKNRHPVHGLTKDDFSVLENGKPQTIVAVAEINAAERDRPGTARMRYAPHDVAGNDLIDQVGDGRIVAIVIDDANLPYDSLPIALSTRTIARYIIDGLGPSDVAAVIYAMDSGRSVDFTNDRAKLIAAIDAYNPEHQPFLYEAPPSGPIGGDIQRSSPMMAGTTCLRSEPAVPALSAVTSRLATIPQRRKSVMFLSVGVALRFGSTSGCPGVLYDEMRDVFRYAQRGNVNIHTIDPSGYGGYASYVQGRQATHGTILMPYERNVTMNSVSSRLDFMKITAENTGGRAVVGTDDLEPVVDEVLEEDASYYLVGYQTSNGKPDGKFRSLDVKVRRSGVTTRARSGYWAPAPGRLEAKGAGGVTSIDASQFGLMEPVALPLRAIAVPLAASGDPAHPQDDVVVGLTVRLPAPREAMPETLTIVRNVYDERGAPGPPVQDKRTLTLEPTAGDEYHYDTFWRLALAPGRYQVRFNATSQAFDKSGSVYVDVEVPDVSRGRLTLSPIVLGAPPAEGAPREDALAALLPIVPTTSRQFASSDAVAAFARIFEGGDEPIAPVTMHVEVLDGQDAPVFDQDQTVDVGAFTSGRTADVQFPLPLSRLSTGGYLLSVTATMGSRSTRRDLTFKVR
jgi:VWFA-related protein